MLAEKSPSKLCLPFYDPSGSYLSVKIFVGISAFTQTATSIITIILHILLVHEIKKSQTNMGPAKSTDSSNTPLIIQLCIVSFSNTICWLPMNIIYTVALNLERYPLDMIIWATSMVLPLNSVINPSVFVITAIKKKFLTKGRKGTSK